MSDFQKFVGRKPHDPYEHLRVDPIEKNKHQKEEPYTGLPSEAHLSLIFAALASCLKQIFRPLENSDHSLQLFFNPQQLLERVLEFKHLLQRLAEEDLSQDPNYIQQLSAVWHNLLDDCNSILSYSESPPEFAQEARGFLQQLTQYPAESDHTLGFYLNKGIGKEWSPFPFMEMLKNLHLACQTSPQTAPLIQWIIALTEILNAQNENVD